MRCLRMWGWNCADRRVGLRAAGGDNIRSLRAQDIRDDRKPIHRRGVTTFRLRPRDSNI